MTEEKFTKASQIKQEIASLKVQMSETIKYKSFAVNHKEHSIAMHSNSPDKGIAVCIPKGVLNSKDTLQIVDIATGRIHKQITKLQRAFDEL